MSSIEFHLLQGECIAGIAEDRGKLYVITNLGRVFESTLAPLENIDFVEITRD